MSLKIDRVQLEIQINNNPARKALRQIDDEIRNLKKEMGKKNIDPSQYKELEARLKAVKVQRDNIVESIGLENLSLKELKAREMELRAIYNQMSPGMKGYKEMEAQIRLVSERKKELLGNIRQTEFSIGKLAQGFNKYFGVITAGIASISGLILTGRKAILAFAEFEEKLVDVIKVTGMTREEVDSLNNSFKAYDTRTAQDQLMELSYVAGKLGLTARKDIEGFVLAADKINVALSKDFGGNAEDTLRTIGKLADVFKVTDEFGIEQAMLKVGSAINELGMASTAQETNIVEFTRRLGGIAPMANISIANILGLGATLDSVGVTVEIAGTAISKFILNMTKDTTTFARYAGMSIQDFTNILNTDANEAFIRVLEGIKGNSGALIDLAGSLSDVQADAGRMAQALGPLINNTERLREQQALSKKSYEEGISVLNEFDLKNNTALATLEKKRKIFKQLMVDLGQKLMPIYTVSTSAISYMARALMILIDFFTKYGFVITSLIASLITYNLITKAAVIGLKLKAFWIATVTKAQALLNATMLKNHIAMVTAAVIGLTVALSGLIRRAREKTEIQRAEVRINKEVNDEYNRTAAEIEKIQKAIENEKLPREERERNINRMREIMPGYNGELDKEGKLIKHNKEAIDAYLVSFRQQLELKARESDIIKLIQDRIEVEKKLDDVRNKNWDQGQAVWVSKHQENLEKEIEDKNKAIEAHEKKIEQHFKDSNLEYVSAEIKRILGLLQKLVPTRDGGFEIVSNTSVENADRLKKRLEELIITRRRLQMQNIVIDEETDPTDFGGAGSPNKSQKAIDYERMLAESRLAIMQDGLDKELAALELSHATKRQKAEEELQNHQYRAEILANIDAEYISSKEAIEQKHRDLELQKTREQETALLQARLDATEVGSEQELAQRLALLDQRHLIELERVAENEDMRRLVELRQQRERDAITNEAALKAVDEVHEEKKLKLLQEHADGLLNEQQYKTNLENLELAHLLTIMQLRKQMGLATIEQEKALADIRIKKQKEANDKMIEQMQNVYTRFQEFVQISNETIQSVIEGNEGAFKNGARQMIEFALDLLKAQMQIAMAGVTIQSLAQPDSILTLGASGLARAAVIIALIEAAFAGVKGVVGKAFQTKEPVPTYAGGSYQHLLGTDGKRHRAKVVDKNHKSGLHGQPTYLPGFGIFGETPEPELVFNPQDTKAIMNTPGLVNAINHTLGNVRVFAQGNAREIIKETTNNTVREIDPETRALMAAMQKHLSKPMRAYVVGTQQYVREHTRIIREFEEFLDRKK